METEILSIRTWLLSDISPKRVSEIFEELRHFLEKYFVELNKVFTKIETEQSIEMSNKRDGILASVNFYFAFLKQPSPKDWIAIGRCIDEQDFFLMP